MADVRKIESKLYNFCLFTAIGAMVVGYFSAVLFQGLYNIATYGRFYIMGATFYGGLIGGAGFFLAIYFFVGNIVFKEDKIHLKRFFDIADIAACSITIAHSLGRVGCLLVGCCHGRVTKEWYGINMWVDLNGDGVLEYAKLVPTQLFEAVFLALLFFYIVLRVKDKQTYCLQIYMCVYGVWRFIIEYMRNDYRGTTVIESVTPSQLIAILMVLGGAALMYLQYRLSDGEKAEEPALVEGVAEANEEAESDESVENADSDEEAEDDYEYASTYAKKDGDTSGNAEDNK
jgi:phosphatidylglycerol:prolipoprotein diacylglycerol transferase